MVQGRVPSATFFHYYDLTRHLVTGSTVDSWINMSKTILRAAEEEEDFFFFSLQSVSADA